MSPAREEEGVTRKSFRAESRADWGRDTTGELGLHDVKLGALLRIADAVEAMSKYHATLIAERDSFKRRFEEERACSERLVRSNRALRGALTRARRAK